ncbi:hypothetical protein D9613_011302 [Agrocybe pediades]|uniref:Uncharacterized protein n=1 Tax=Agrocybe pediades TaxID=84607 RepID=A0A8H4VN33_9AGAR|nr:hypothetical protein D9613_011302 [Agrocybe pediades]
MTMRTRWPTLIILPFNTPLPMPNRKDSSNRPQYSAPIIRSQSSLRRLQNAPNYPQQRRIAAQQATANPAHIRRSARLAAKRGDAPYYHNTTPAQKVHAIPEILHYIAQHLPWKSLMDLSYASRYTMEVVRHVIKTSIQKHDMPFVNCHDELVDLFNLLQETEVSLHS